MNPLLLAFLGSVARWILSIVFSWLLAHEVITSTEANQYLDALTSPVAMAALVGLLSQLAWSLYKRYWDRKKLTTALASPLGTSESDVERMVSSKDMHTPPAAMPKEVAPYGIVSKQVRPSHIEE